MISVANTLLFAGYTLAYAAVANGGVFVKNPWMGLFTDAYTQADGTSNDGSGSSGTGIAGQIAGAAGKAAENTLVGSKTANKANSNISGAAKLNEEWGKAIVNAIKGALQGRATGIPASARKGEATRGRPGGQTR